MSLPTQTASQVVAGEPIRQRLVELASGEGATARAGQLLGKVAAPPPLSAAAFTRIEQKLLSNSPAAVGTASLLRWLGIGVAVVAVGGTSMLVARRGDHRSPTQARVLVAPSTVS